MDVNGVLAGKIKFSLFPEKKPWLSISPSRHLPAWHPLRAVNISFLDFFLQFKICYYFFPGAASFPWSGYAMEELRF